MCAIKGKTDANKSAQIERKSNNPIMALQPPAKDNLKKLMSRFVHKNIIPSPLLFTGTG